MKSNKMPPYKWQFEALGTKWCIETPSELSADKKKRIANRIEVFDKTYSRFRGDSFAARLRVPGEYEFPADVVPLLTLYNQLYHITHGRMTPLVGGLLEQAGYDAAYSFKSQRLDDVPPFDALGWNGKTTVRLRVPIVLDVGAAGKGYLVDILGEVLERCGVDEYTVDAAGDIKRKGSLERIGLEHPANPSEIIGVANLANGSLGASAINRRAWRNMHHVFDAISKKPTQSMVATWVVADTTLLADALASALFFVSPQELTRYFLFEWVTISEKGQVDVSPGFDGELFV